MATEPRSRQERDERIAHEKTVLARLARLQDHYEKLEQGLSVIEQELGVDSASPLAETTARETKRPKRYRPRKPR